MATAASLNATSTIINEQGLNVNANIIASISSFSSVSTISTTQSIFSATQTANIANLTSVVTGIGSGATQGKFLLDLYPANITPTSSGTITKYLGSANLSSWTSAVTAQAQIPFANGMAGFANVFTMSQSYALSVFDTVASLKMLENKTYGQSGLGYGGVKDLVTGGIGSNAAILGSAIVGWGTMYNITNINLITDPYVFGQNLLDQGFGSYGNLAVKLTALGLDTADITKVPPSIETTTAETNTATTQTLVGEVEVPTIANVTVTNTVTGNSPATVVAVYKTITGTDLQDIISATQFDTTGTNITTLADLLDFDKAINSTSRAQLSGMGITTFSAFTTYLNSRIGQGALRNWKSVGEFLANVDVPTIPHTTTISSDPVVHSSTFTTLRNETGLGSGYFGHPILIDFLGATSGNPYNTYFATLTSSYSSITSISSVESALSNLLSAVNTAIATYVPPVDEVPGANPGDPPITPGEPEQLDIAPVISALSALDSALNGLSGEAFVSAQTAQYRILNRISTEVSNLQKAGAVFGSASSKLKMNFGQRIGGLGAKDLTGLETDSFIANIITDDFAGDTIRVVISEVNNTTILGKNGITLNNDPNPRQAVTQSLAQNIPLSTYLSQNK